MQAEYGHLPASRSTLRCRPLSRMLKGHHGIRFATVLGLSDAFDKQSASNLPPAGSRTPQRFIAYGAMVGAPLFNDNLVNTRKDYTYMEPTTGAC